MREGMTQLTVQFCRETLQTRILLSDWLKSQHNIKSNLTTVELSDGWSIYKYIYNIIINFDLIQNILKPYIFFIL